jgi:mono/diheme cytochrome c family protein
MHKWVMFVLFSVACLVGIIGITTQYGGGTGEQAQAGPAIDLNAPVDVAAAEALYKNNCLSCHGANLEGGMFPALNKVGATLDREAIYKTIANGASPMPAFKSQLKPEEINNLAGWLAALK